MRCYTKGTMAIEQFRGDYFFLSNMYPLTVPIQSECGLLVPTAEHAYQSAKFLDPEIQYMIASLSSGKETKAVAHELEAKGLALCPGWYTARIGIMLSIERQKFQLNDDIAEKLVLTDGEELVEGNPWGDRFWGVCPVGSRDGENQLGKSLTIVRHELKTSRASTT